MAQHPMLITAAVSQYKHYVFTDESGSFRWVYCVESGVRFGNSDDGYYSEHTENSEYFNQLPKASQRGIMLTSLYGWQPGACSAYERNQHQRLVYGCAVHYVGISAAASAATPTAAMITDRLRQIPSIAVVKGRPAEKVYNWILEQIASHSTIPSFAGETTAVTLPCTN